METSLGSKRPNPRQRELPVSLFLSGLPTWAAAILLVIAPTIAAMCGPVLMRRRVGLERLTSNNEIAGFKFATVGVIYAVLMAFAVIVAWEKFSEAEIAVVKEAGASAILYGLLRGRSRKRSQHARLWITILGSQSIGTGRRWKRLRQAARLPRRSTRSMLMPFT
jgi:hypothetical protein